MSDKPSFLNINFTSFKQKQSYQPPTITETFNNKKDNQNKQKHIPGGEWADDDNDLELQVEEKQKFFDPFKPTQQLQEKKEDSKNSKFNFIVRKQKDQQKVKDNKELLTFEEIRAEQQKFVNDLVQPVGATKKPQNSLLNQFVQKAGNFEEHVVSSILWHVLTSQNLNWISKLVNQKENLDLDQIQQQSSSGASNIQKLLARIQKKLDKNFTGEENFNNFDMSKLEQMKEQGNQDFFESMNKLTNQEQVNTQDQQQLIDLDIQPQQKKQQQSSDFLDLDFTSNNDTKTQGNKVDDMFGFDNVEPVKKKQDNLTDEFDLLNLDTNQPKEKKVDILDKNKNNDEFNFLF